MGTYGYLPTLQPQLQSLSLITNRECDVRWAHGYNMDLLKFERLRSFPWLAVGLPKDFLAMKDGILASRKSLEELTIGFATYDAAEQFWNFELLGGIYHYVFGT